MKSVKYTMLKYYPNFLSEEYKTLGILFVNESEGSVYFVNNSRLEEDLAETDASIEMFIVNFTHGVSDDFLESKKPLKDYVKYFINSFRFSEIKTDKCENVYRFSMDKSKELGVI